MKKKELWSQLKLTLYGKRAYNILINLDEDISDELLKTDLVEEFNHKDLYYIISLTNSLNDLKNIIKLYQEHMHNSYILSMLKNEEILKLRIINNTIKTYEVIDENLKAEAYAILMNKETIKKGINLVGVYYLQKLPLNKASYVKSMFTHPVILKNNLSFLGITLIEKIDNENILNLIMSSLVSEYLNNNNIAYDTACIFSRVKEEYLTYFMPILFKDELINNKKTIIYGNYLLENLEEIDRYSYKDDNGYKKNYFTLIFLSPVFNDLDVVLNVIDILLDKESENDLTKLKLIMANLLKKVIILEEINNFINNILDNEIKEKFKNLFDKFLTKLNLNENLNYVNTVKLVKKK